MKISELTLIEAQIGGYIGVLIGVISSWIFILFFVNWAWYFKLFSSIGEIGIVLIQIISLRQLFITRKNYLNAQQAIQQYGEKD